MTVTTEGAVFREILSDLKTILADANPDTVFGDRVYIRSVAGFDADISPPYVQIVPGPATELHPESADSVIRQTFQTVIFHRMALDEWGQDTIKFSDSAFGIIAIRDVIRGDGGSGTPLVPGSSPSGLINSIPSAGAPFPIVLLSWSAPIVNPNDPYWISVSDTFRVQWEMM